MHKLSLLQFQILNSFFLELSQAFNLFDRDGSGEISRDELTDVMRELGIQLSEKELNDIVEMIDTSGKNSAAMFDFFLTTGYLPLF